MKKMTIARLACLVLALLLLAAALGCGGGDEAPSSTEEETEAELTEPVDEEEESVPAEDGERTFTVQELAEFDGKNGTPAYVAVEGVVYDVTGSRHWQSGVHTDCSFMPEAGADLTEDLKRSPGNMEALIKGMPVVGKMAGQ